MKKHLRLHRLWILFVLLLSATGWGQTNIIPTRTDVSGFPSWTDSNITGSSYLQLLTSTSSTITPVMNFDAFTAEKLNFQARTYGGADAAENTITVSVSTDNGVNWTVIGTRLPAGNNLAPVAEFDLSGYSGNLVRLKFSVAGTKNSIGAGIDNIAITGMPAAATSPPTVTPATLSGTVGAALSYPIQATGNPTSFAVASGTLPAGLSLNVASGIISGTPTSAGNYSAEVTASNAIGTSSPAAVTFNIAKGDQTIAAFRDTAVNYPSQTSVTLPQNSDQGLPVTYTSSDNSVATVSGNSLTFLQQGTVTVTAQQSGNMDYNALTDAKVFKAITSCFSEDFASAASGNSTGTSGSNSAWKGNTNFPDVASAYQAGGAVRIGASSASGFIKSKILNSIGGDVTVTFDVKGWTTVETGIKVTLGTQSQTVNYTSTLSGSFQSQSLNFTNVPAGATLEISTAAVGRAFIDNVYVSCGTATVWDGTSWSNGVPASTTVTVINEDYTGAGFETAALTVNSGFTLNVSETVNVHGNVLNSGTIVVNENGNFIQSGNSQYSGSGTFTVNRNSLSAADKYTFWSSPVQDQNMFGIYPGYTPQYVMSYNSNTDYYTTLTNPVVAVPGMGYSVKVPAAGALVSFTGTPNNGTLSVPLDNNAADSSNGNTWNLVGNPYPSSLDLSALYKAGTNGIDSSMYFWNNITAANTSQTGAGATTWAVYNAASSTWNGSVSGLLLNGNSVKPGQGFLVKATASSVNFENTMRGSNTGVSVNRFAQSLKEGKYWLKLAASDSTCRTLAVTYGQGASSTVDAFDSQLMGAPADTFYSVNSGQKFLIQGRTDFVDTDMVVVGNKHSASGQYTISLLDKTGVFASGQNIYLRDKYLNTYTDLQTDSYTFSTAAGDFIDRFEIVYLAQAQLASQETVKDDVKVYASGSSFIILSPSRIDKVEIYDTAGRLINSLKPGAQTAELNLGSKGLYVLKITTDGKIITKKIIK